ncbi:MAG: [LysW]-lysine hydrolase [Firmicutes bacterium]|nr:[LysW]-lysine hydrolase [Bacillota bacterium]
MCETYSPSGCEAAVAEYLVETMKSYGWRSYVDEAGNAVGEAGEGPRTLLFLGHIDTAPGFIPVRIEDGVLHGRGSVDAKGSLAAFISALARVTARASRLPGRVVVVGAVEEETDSSRGARHARAAFSPDWCVIGEPSGAHSVTLGYKGRLSAAVVVDGSVSHSASGRSTAAENAVGVWTRIREYCRAHSPGDSAFSRFDVSLRDIHCETDGFQETCRLALVFRLPPGAEPSAFSTALSSEFPEARYSFSGGVPAYRADKNNPLARAFVGAVRAVGGTPAFKLKTGTSDMNVVGHSWSCPIVAYGPGDSSLDHTPCERLPLEEYATAIEVCARVIESL